MGKEELSSEKPTEQVVETDKGNSKYARYLECYCTDCRSEFMITSKRQFPYEEIVCPRCQSKLIRFIKIEGG